MFIFVGMVLRRSVQSLVARCVAFLNSDVNPKEIQGQALECDYRTFLYVCFHQARQIVGKAQLHKRQRRHWIFLEEFVMIFQI